MRGRHPPALPEAGGERIRGALGGLGAARVSGSSADLRPAALGEGAARVHRSLQPSPAAPGPRSASALSASRRDRHTGWPGGASRSPRWPAPRVRASGVSEVTQEGVTGQAIELATNEGWPNVTMRKIADKIEYSHAALYEYFPGRSAARARGRVGGRARLMTPERVTEAKRMLSRASVYRTCLYEMTHWGEEEKP